MVEHFSACTVPLMQPLLLETLRIKPKTKLDSNITPHDELDFQMCWLLSLATLKPPGKPFGGFVGCPVKGLLDNMSKKLQALEKIAFTRGIRALDANDW